MSLQGSGSVSACVPEPVNSALWELRQSANRLYFGVFLSNPVDAGPECLGHSFLLLASGTWDFSPKLSASPVLSLSFPTTEREHPLTP